MHYIIHPIWFYIADIAASMQVLCGVLAILFSMTGCIFVASDNNDFTADYLKKAKRTGKRLLITGLCLAILWALIPSKQAIYCMMVANVITSENIEAGADFTQEQIAKIADKIADEAIRIKEANK